MTRSLVIGGSGYVGRELTRQLAAQDGDEVHLLGRSQPAADLPATWIEADITDRESLRAALEGREYDVIYHLASLPGDTGDPLQMVTVNLLGLTHALEIARDMAGLKRFVLSSSISAYEWYPATKFRAPAYQPVDEEHPTRPEDMYSVTKRAQELIALTFWHQDRLPVTVLRLTAVIGPEGSGGGRSWRAFARMLAEGKHVEIPFFSMEEVCHFIDLRDAARMHLVAAEHPGAVGQIFNCCGAQSTSGAEFAAALQRLRPGIEVVTGFPWSMAQGDVIEFGMRKARDLLGFTPERDIEDTLAHLLAWVEGGGLERTPDPDEEVSDTGVEAD